MSVVIEDIDKMTLSEKLETMNYFGISFSASDEDLVAAWHQSELAKTEARVAAGVESPISWTAAKDIIKSAF